MICKEKNMMLQPVTDVTQKKMVLLPGTFLTPVIRGEQAIFTYNGEVVRTSTVIAILEITAEYIKFETRNSIYIVSYRNFPPTHTCA